MKHGFLVFESDPHAGHKEGLLPETVDLMDQFGKIHTIETNLSATQRKLLNIRNENIGRLPDLVKRAPWALWVLGDLTQGTRYHDDVSENDNVTQGNIAFQNMYNLAQMKPRPKFIRAMRGTPVHSPVDKMLATRFLERKIHPDILMPWYSRVAWKGFIVEAKHNGPARGARFWTKSNPAYHFLRDQVMQEVDDGHIPAHLYAYGHIHEERQVPYRHKSKGRWYDSMLLTIPSMCGSGTYARKAVANMRSVTNGWTIVEVKDNRIYEIHDWTHTQDLRHHEVIE